VIEAIAGHTGVIIASLLLSPLSAHFISVDFCCISFGYWPVHFDSFVSGAKSVMTRLVCFSIQYNTIFIKLMQCTSWNLDGELLSMNK
jgi:hypothetical protein